MKIQALTLMAIAFVGGLILSTSAEARDRHMLDNALEETFVEKDHAQRAYRSNEAAIEAATQKTRASLDAIKIQIGDELGSAQLRPRESRAERIAKKHQESAATGYQQTFGATIDN